jgi:hypothetical protein
MPRTELLRRLADSDSLSPAACLVLLWTYFEDDRIGLATVENLVRAQWRHPLRLPAYDHATARTDLLGRNDAGELDLIALRWLKGLDLLLNQAPFQDFEDDQLTGFDGRPYSVRRRNAFLASHYQERRLPVRWVAHQGLSLAAYCRHFVCVPSHPVRGFQIRSRSSWAPRHLLDRLEAERERLRIMLWSFQTPAAYPGLAALNAEAPPEKIVLDEIGNEPELQEEIQRAIGVAREERVTLLLFPELSIPPASGEQIRRVLARHGVDGFPILTLFGCCHRLNERGDLHVTEAVLLGPDGSELHRHPKLVPFTDYRFGEGNPVGENLETGRTVAVLESALGNLTPLICIDLLNEEVKEVLRQSHGNLFPVPSLSEETKAHRHAALTLQVRALASTFVCNRWTTPPSKDSASFCRTPRPGGLVLHWPNPAALPYLLFDLDASLAG